MCAYRPCIRASRVGSSVLPPCRSGRVGATASGGGRRRSDGRADEPRGAGDVLPDGGPEGQVPCDDGAREHLTRRLEDRHSGNLGTNVDQ